MPTSKYFIPYCVRPVYLLEAEENAKKCGLIDGISYTFLTSLIVIAFAVRYYLRETNEDYRKKIMYGTGIFLLLFWIIVPYITRFGNGNVWKGYDDMFQYLMKQGYTKDQAIRIIQGISPDTGPQMGLIQGVTSVVFSNTKDKTEQKTEQKNGEKADMKTETKK